MASKSKGIGLDKPAMAKAMKPMKMSDDMRYKAESDMRTMREAHMIEKSPERVRMVKMMAKEEMMALEHIAGKKKR